MWELPQLLGAMKAKKGSKVIGKIPSELEGEGYNCEGREGWGDGGSHLSVLKD